MVILVQRFEVQIYSNSKVTEEVLRYIIHNGLFHENVSMVIVEEDIDSK